jgi:hypothetical protein
MRFGPRTVFLLRGQNGWRAFLTDVHHLVGESTLWWCPVERQFAAPTHGERFDETGDVVGGTPRRGLDQLLVDVAGANLTIHLHDVYPGRPVDVSQQRPLTDNSPWDGGAGSFCVGAVKAEPSLAPPTQPEPELSGLGVPGLRVVFDDRAYDSWEPTGDFISVAGPPAKQPPVATTTGILNMVPDDAASGTLWLRTPTGVERLAEAVTDFAVSPDGLRVAVSKVVPPGATAQLQEVDVTSRAVVHEQSVACSAHVRGYAGEVVLVDLCEGAAATAAVWSPSTNAVTPIDRGFDHVLGTDPGRRRALLARGDGTCALLAVAGGDGSSAAGEQVQGIACEPRGQGLFAPSGTALALNTGDFDEPDVAFVDVAHGQRLGEVLVRHVVASVWVEESLAAAAPRGDVLFAVSNAEDGYRLVRCVPSIGECTVMARLKRRPTALLAMGGS